MISEFIRSTNLMTDKFMFEAVSIFGHPMLYTDFRVDHKSAPNGIYVYELRDVSTEYDKELEISEWVVKNHEGTIVTNRPIKLRHSTVTSAYRSIFEENFHFEGYAMTLQDYISKFKNQESKEEL